MVLPREWRGLGLVLIHTGIEGTDPLTVGQIAEHFLNKKGGIGVYQTFTHVDTRTTRSRWDQRSGKQQRI